MSFHDDAEKQRQKDAQRAKVYQKCKMPHRVQFVLYSSGFSKAIYHVKHQKEWLIDKCLVLENRYQYPQQDGIKYTYAGIQVTVPACS